MDGHSETLSSHDFCHAATVLQTSCGAGLPVLSTLKALIESGDEIISIEGILSGTLSYIFNTWRAGEPFSSVVLKAKELGYTEPDPREDLSGMDVARKVCRVVSDAFYRTLPCTVNNTLHCHTSCRLAAHLNGQAILLHS